MFKQALALGAVIAVIICTLLINLYILDWMKFPELMENVRKLLAIIAISTVAALSILAVVKVSEKK
jgi:hypothetical protein